VGRRGRFLVIVCRFCCFGGRGGRGWCWLGGGGAVCSSLEESGCLYDDVVDDRFVESLDLIKSGLVSFLVVMIWSLVILSGVVVVLSFVELEDDLEEDDLFFFFVVVEFVLLLLLLAIITVERLTDPSTNLLKLVPAVPFLPIPSKLSFNLVPNLAWFSTNFSSSSSTLYSTIPSISTAVGRKYRV